MAANKQIWLHAKILSYGEGKVASSPSLPREPDLYAAHTFFSASSRYCHQVSHSHEVVGRSGPSEHPPYSRQAAEACFAHQGHGLEPTEDFLHPLPFPLTDPVARMPSGALINRTAPRPPGVLCHMGRDLQISQGGHKLPHVIVLVPGQGEAPALAVLFDRATAASRSAVPVAEVNRVCTTSP